MDHQPVDHSSSTASRWGGAFLALGSLTYTIAVVLFVLVYGRPDGTGPDGEATLSDRVAHYQGRQQVAHMMWFVETLAAVLIAVAGFILLHRVPAVKTWLPSRVGWATVGVGAVLLSLMYPFMLGGYPAAAAAASNEGLGLFDALNNIATFLFHIGNAVVFSGFAGAFLSEAAPGGVIARGLALGGMTVCLLGTVTASAMIAGVGAMAFAAPLGFIGFLLAAYLGVAIWRKG